jgi:hypothetical protein
MPLIRGHHFFDGQFTQIPNAWLRDSRLSLQSIGLLAQLLSHEPGWKISQESLAKANGVGRDGMRSMLNELIAAGYLSKSEHRERNSSGQLAGYVYQTQDPQVSKPMLAEPTQAEPTQAETTLKNTIEKNTIVKNTIRENRASKMPQDWQPSESLMELFETKWSNIHAEKDYHIEQFKLYWLASGKPMKSWDLTFQKWMNTENRKATPKLSEQERIRREWGNL